MFTADEVTRVVDLGKLRRLKHEIVSLFLKLASVEGNSSTWDRQFYVTHDTLLGSIEFFSG